MQKSNKQITAILAATLALSLLVTACNKGSDTPTGDNPTPHGTSVTTTQTSPDNTTPPPVTSSTPTETHGKSNTPYTSSTPAKTPSESNSPNTSTQTQTPKYTMPSYDDVIKADIDTTIVSLGERAGVDIDNALNIIHENYGKYLDVNISKDAIRVGIVMSVRSSYSHGKAPEINITGISPDTITKTNEFLVSMGEEPLGISDPDLLAAHNEMLRGIGAEPVPAILTPEENITAFWLATSLFYNPNIESTLGICADIALPFGAAWANPTIPDDAKNLASYFLSRYIGLYGGWDAVAALNN